ncbi:MAG: FAD-dependent oxidoreductase, partial [Syntrophales bacterium]|nr:FAD-dependent oxidoreductase [Syntrophales bacterium]
VCELRKLAKYVGMRVDISPYAVKGLPVVADEPLFKRDYNLCIGCTRCVRVCNEVRGIGALTFTTVDGSLIVGAAEPTLKDSGCKFCGACVEVCPTGALTDKGIIWAEREKYLVPCKNACPVGMDVPAYVRLIAGGNFADAGAVVHEKAPFPATLGRVCFHPCEDVCRRAELDEAIAVKELKRCAADHDGGLWKEKDKVADKTGKKAAIVGSGPAGMTCGYYLAKQGHAVVVFEALPDPGGMLRFGIPGHRLPRDILKREIEDVRQAGVEFKTNAMIISLEEIFAQGFDAIFLALGLQGGARLGIKGEDFQEVIDGISFLREVNLEKNIDLGASVAVIGGGNVAIDASRTALRLGAKEVTILYRRSEAEMPAYLEEVEQAENEGVKIDFLVTPKKISKSNGKLEVECLRMKLGETDASGRKHPNPIEGSEFNMRFDNVIVA